MLDRGATAGVQGVMTLTRRAEGRSGWIYTVARMAA